MFPDGAREARDDSMLTALVIGRIGYLITMTAGGSHAWSMSMDRWSMIRSQTDADFNSDLAGSEYRFGGKHLNTHSFRAISGAVL